MDTEKLVMQGTEKEGKLDEEKIMILNHKEAIKHLAERIDKVEMNCDKFCTLHYLLSDALVPIQYSGKVRDHGMRISASTYIPLENPKRLKLQLELIGAKARAIKDPFEQSFFLLVQISYLQAFTDVNKRTSRLCANIPLIKNDLVPLSFNGVAKDDYINAMIAIHELNDTSPLADLYCFSYLRTCREYTVTLQSIGFDEVRVRYRKERRELIRHIILNKLIAKPLETYINKQVKKWVPQQDQGQFKINVQEDLEQMNIARMAGLGVTQQELQVWLALFK